MISGKHLRGILSYNEYKVGKGKAVLLGGENLAVPPELLSFSQKLAYLEKVAAQNPRVTTNALHISLNFAREDVMSAEQLLEISHGYMAGIGFSEQPYLVYQHLDAAHPHVHIVTTNVRPDGSRIDLHNIGRNRSEPVRKALENAYGLVVAEGRSQGQALPVAGAELKRVTYGKDGTKQAISNVVRPVVRGWKYTSLAELNAVLRQYGVTADRGLEGSRLSDRNGLLYRMVDEQGRAIGVPIKASSIYGKPTLKFLEKRFVLNAELRKPEKEKLKSTIARVLEGKPDRKKFCRQLAAMGIVALFRENDDGRVYGVTFTDHRSRSVFKGSDLGKEFSAGALVQQVGGEGAPANLRVPVSAWPVPGNAALETLATPIWDALLHTEWVPAVPLPRKKKKKRKLRL